MLDFLRPARLKGLSAHERLAYVMGAAINETPAKHVAMWMAGSINTPWVKRLTIPKTQFDGLEHIPVGQSFIIAANHRTFFDLFAVTACLWSTLPFENRPHMYCPVRSEWFYTTLTGPLLNTAISGYSMYPPIFRDQRGPELNEAAISACKRLVNGDRHAVLAMHPEGRRNKGDDPYTFLPAKRGIGRIALETGIPVVPVFINGLAPSFGDQIKQRFKRPETLRVFFGAPIELGDLSDRANDPDAWLEAAQRSMVGVGTCAQRERQWTAHQTP
jgi:1-acyl-sn-glycerol-3-phosphate acyltransferase